MKIFPFEKVPLSGWNVFYLHLKAVKKLVSVLEELIASYFLYIKSLQKSHEVRK